MKTVGALVFPGLKLLDIFGPLEMLGLLTDDIEIRMVAEYEWHRDPTWDPFAKIHGLV